MGGNTFTNVVNDTDIKRAFRDITQSARHERGHGGYTGTIAEKSEYTIIESTPMSLDAAYDRANRLIDMNDERIDDKWGPAGAIRVRDAKVDGWLFFGWASS